MESHLSEEVKRKIEEYAFKHGFLNASRDRSTFHFREGAEFGYRLALQSKGEELDKLALELSETIIEKDKLFDIADSLTSENERLRGLLGDVLAAFDQNGAIHERLRHEIDSLLSQSTDKP